MRLAVLSLLSCAALSSARSQNASEFLQDAIQLMEEFPLLDTHIDLPQIIRSLS